MFRKYELVQFYIQFCFFFEGDDGDKVINNIFSMFGKFFGTEEVKWSQLPHETHQIFRHLVANNVFGKANKASVKRTLEFYLKSFAAWDAAVNEVGNKVNENGSLMLCSNLKLD